MRYPGATVSARIAAPMDQIWAIVSDVERHNELAGSGQVQQITIPERPLQRGSIFVSQQQINTLRYTTASRVVSWEPPYLFAWQVGFPASPGVAQVWMFRLTPEAGGTRVENGVAAFLALPSFSPFADIAQRFAQFEIEMMTPTLSNLARLLDAPPPEDFRSHPHAPLEAIIHLPSPLVHLGVWLSLGAGAAWLLRRQMRNSRARAKS